VLAEPVGVLSGMRAERPNTFGCGIGRFCTRACLQTLITSRYTLQLERR
jgi:hypothetical protein